MWPHPIYIKVLGSLYNLHNRYKRNKSKFKPNRVNLLIISRLIYNRHSNFKRIEKSMSNGRKIFRFLKFIEDLKKFWSYLYDSSFDMFTILKAFTCLSACFYHFLDNLVWVSNVGMIDRIITGDINWKSSKNLFSIIRTLIKLVTYFINFKGYYYNSWINNDQIVDDNYEKIVNETIKNRSKLRMLSLDILQSLLKLCTSLYSLKFQPISNLFHPIIVSFCGIGYCIISLLKIYLKTQDKQKKMLRSFYKSSNDVLTKSKDNILLGDVTSCINLTYNTGIKSKQSHFELSCLEHVPNHKLMNDDSYFENYYIDFNKDYPMVSELVLKANGGDFKKMNE